MRECVRVLRRRVARVMRRCVRVCCEGDEKVCEGVLRGCVCYLVLPSMIDGYFPFPTYS